jgi:hypothetical protein
MILQSLFSLLKTVEDTKIPKQLLGMGVHDTQIKSLSDLSKQNTYYFPVICSENITSDEAKMLMSALEFQYANFTKLAFSLMPTMKVDDATMVDIRLYLNKFHQNHGSTSFKINESVDTWIVESSLNNIPITQKALHEMAGKKKFESKYNPKNNPHRNMDITVDGSEGGQEGPDKGRSAIITPKSNQVDDLNSVTTNAKKATYTATESKINTPVIKISSKEDTVTTADPTEFQKNRPTIESRNMFVDSDVKKANAMMPTIVNAQIGFLIGANETFVEQNVLIGVKTFFHKVTSKEIKENIVDCITKNRVFFRFIKWITGESESLRDLVFGISEIKLDVKRESNSGYSQWWAALKRRKRLNSMSIPFLKQGYKPNATIIMTMDEVISIRNEYGIDIMSAAAKIIDEYFLLGFIIVDQLNNSVNIMYDGFSTFQEYPYTTLERENNNNDREMKTLIQAMGKMY